MRGQQYSIVVPVYGRSALLKPCFASIARITDKNYELLIADDGSDQKTREFISQWNRENRLLDINWVRRERNLGLFANLNKAICEAKYQNILLLCSDDILMPDALARLGVINVKWPEADLVLSTFRSINEDGSPRYDDSAWHHDQVTKQTGLVERSHLLECLLKLGSINGNLSGMTFTKDVWQRVGPFKEDWKHAADWEWLTRVAAQGTVVFNRVPVAAVRTHREQLSNKNRVDGHELREVAIVVKMLIAINEKRGKWQRTAWAAHVMHFQLWNVLKSARSRRVKDTFQDVKRINGTVGLSATFLALLLWLPQRIGRAMRCKMRLPG